MKVSKMTINERSKLIGKRAIGRSSSCVWKGYICQIRKEEFLAPFGVMIRNENGIKSFWEDECRLLKKKQKPAGDYRVNTKMGMEEMRQTRKDGITKIEHTISETMSEYLRVHNEHLEMFAAAFLKRVGSAAADEYVLVERRDGCKVTWSFEHKRFHPEAHKGLFGPESQL